MPTKIVEGGKKTGAKNNALMIPKHLSPELEAIVGKGPMARSQVVKKVWEYIKKHNLQDKADKRDINPDTLLAKVIGHTKINMFKMTKKISEHIKK